MYLVRKSPLQQCLDQTYFKCKGVEQFSCLYWWDNCFGCEKIRPAKCVLPSSTWCWRVCSLSLHIFLEILPYASVSLL